MGSRFIKGFQGGKPNRAPALVPAPVPLWPKTYRKRMLFEAKLAKPQVPQNCPAKHVNFILKTLVFGASLTEIAQKGWGWAEVAESARIILFCSPLPHQAFQNTPTNTPLTPRTSGSANYFFGRKRFSENASKAPSELPKRLQTASGRSPGTFQESIWSSEAALGVFRCPRGPLSGRSGTHQDH